MAVLCSLLVACGSPARHPPQLGLGTSGAITPLPVVPPRALGLTANRRPVPIVPIYYAWAGAVSVRTRMESPVDWPIVPSGRRIEVQLVTADQPYTVTYQWYAAIGSNGTPSGAARWASGCISGTAFAVGCSFEVSRGVVILAAPTPSSGSKAFPKYVVWSVVWRGSAYGASSHRVVTFDTASYGEAIVQSAVS